MVKFYWFELMGIPHHWVHVVGAVIIAIILSGIGLWIRARSRRVEELLVPTAGFTVQNLSEIFVEFIRGLTYQITHTKNRRTIAILGTTFLFILFSNLIGLIPGMFSPTKEVNTNLAIAIAIFVCYHAFGLREHGVGYFRQFTGGLVGWLALMWILVIPIELIGHVIRPLSLTLRLWGNMTGGSTLLGVMSDLGRDYFIPLPVLILFFETLVAFIQAFVFTLLSTIYIGLAVSHDH